MRDSSCSSFIDPLTGWSITRDGSVNPGQGGSESDGRAERLKHRRPESLRGNRPGAPARQRAGATRLVIGRNGKTAVATLVERTSRFLVLAPLTGRDALTVGQAVIAATGGLPAEIRRSLTWDCGTEMARHADITATGLPVYFAHPHCRGNAAATRTSTASSGSSSRKVWISPPISTIWRWWLVKSTTGPVRS